MRRLSLRARLVLGVIVLAAAGLAVANVVTYTSLRSFLYDQTDLSLQESRGGVARELLGHGCRDKGPPPRGVAAGTYVEVRNSGGEVVCSAQVTGFGDEAPPPPELPADVSAPEDGGRGPAAYFTAESAGGDRYRVQVSSEPRGDATLLIATPLAGVDDTLARLLAIEALVTVAVLLALAVLGLWVVRLGLRPLDAIGDTAAAIAAGDLSRRVERAEPRTEVGRLGMSLNSMLGQIETAFRAQAASEQKLRRFVADASHELRTPLAAVRAYAELFSRGAAARPEDLARSMSGITRESERMSLLVEDLLLLARLDEGRPLEREPVRLDEVVAEAADTARTVEPARPIELDTAPAVVLGDRHRLRQSVDNLLANVRGHTPPEARVRVRVASEDGNAVIEVADSGPGMEADDAARVFERFYRSDQSRARASGGVGLGLSIVAAVAEAHGGLAAAESRPGEGASFRIVIPLLTTPSGDSQESHSAFPRDGASMG